MYGLEVDEKIHLEVNAEMPLLNEIRNGLEQLCRTIEDETSIDYLKNAGDEEFSSLRTEIREGLLSGIRN